MMLQSKAAVVTGSTSGIGLAIARALAKEGANVLLNGFGDAGEIETIDVLKDAAAQPVLMSGVAMPATGSRRPLVCSMSWAASRNSKSGTVH